jgi:hypothetical protein
MSSGPACDAQVVQATRNGDHNIRQSIGSVAELILGNATDLHARNRMLHPHANASQAAVVPFLARFQFRVLGLFFGCRCIFTAG